MRQILAVLGCIVLPTQFALARAGEAFDETGALRDAAQRKAVDAVAVTADPDLPRHGLDDAVDAHIAGGIGLQHQLPASALAPEDRDRVRITVSRPGVVGRPARVTASMRHHFTVPLLDGLGVNLSATASMLVER